MDGCSCTKNPLKLGKQNQAKLFPYKHTGIRGQWGQREGHRVPRGVFQGSGASAASARPTLRPRSPLTPAGLSEGTTSSAGLSKSKYSRCSYLICLLLNGRIDEAINVYEELSVSALPMRGGEEKPSWAWTWSQSPGPFPSPGSG